jgi:uncharacterized protein
MNEKQLNGSVDLDRRAFLQLVSLGAGAAAGWSLASCATSPASSPESWVGADGSPIWTPPPLPMPAWGDGGSATDDAQRFASYTLPDELVVPQGFRCEVLASWGDALGPDAHFGFNADFTALVPIAGRPDEFWLAVNHEFISFRPWSQGYATATGKTLPTLRLALGAAPDSKPQLEVAGKVLDAGSVDLTDSRSIELHGEESVRALREICRAALGDLGVSVVHVRRRADGSFERVPGSTQDKRISGAHPSTPTFGNCSGGVTPWGTVLTCEENYQDQVRDEVDCRGRLIESAPRPFGYAGFSRQIAQPQELRQIGQGLERPLEGRDFGWVCEVDPVRGTLRKLRRLGRFRHENASVRCVAGQPLAVYLGDDRRGGHVWRFVSRAAVRDPSDPDNSKLFDDGILCAARFAADGTGEWVPLEPATPLARPAPELTTSGHLWLPDRRVPSAGAVPSGGRVVVRASDSKAAGLSADEWVASVELACGRPFAELTLGDLVWEGEGAELTATELERWRRDVILLEAFAMAGAIGATPTARPEDVDLHPLDGSLYIAFTESSGDSEGSPDRRLFPPELERTARRYGAIFRLVEGAGAGSLWPGTFTWSRFVSSGELFEEGGAFACADNLVFDPAGSLWITCDLAGDTVFGNSSLFMVPTRGPSAGRPICFAIGPAECELTGPTFAPDGRALIVSVQHPGEQHGTRAGSGGALPASLEREITVSTRAGERFTQRRTVPLGSNFPSGRAGDPPRPCVVVITRAS